jgi:hypothetical protein
VELCTSQVCVCEQSWKRPPCGAEGVHALVALARLLTLRGKPLRPVALSQTGPRTQAGSGIADRSLK